MSGLDWLVLLLLGVGILLAVRQIRRGKGDCAGGCSGCADVYRCQKKQHNLRRRSPEED